MRVHKYIDREGEREEWQEGLKSGSEDTQTGKKEKEKVSQILTK